MEVSQMRSKAAVFQRGIAALRDAGIENPALDAAVLLGYVTGEPAEAVLIDRDAVVTPFENDRYDALILERCSRAAVSRIVGEKEFYSRNFYVTGDVLDPRPETELLVDEAIRCLQDQEGGLAIMDIGTGSGAIAVTMAAELPGARVTATDISMAALAVAKRNAVRNHVRDQLNFIQADLLSGISRKGSFHAILSNPPYIPRSSYQDLQDEVRKGDPMVALVPGPDGTECYPPLAAGAMELLAAGGSLFVEVGAGQAGAVAGIFQKAGLADIRIVDDLAGIGRVVRGKK